MIIPIIDPSDDGPTDVTIKMGPSTTTQETFVAPGFLTEYKIDGPLDGKVVTATMKIKLTDDDSYTSTGAVGWTSADPV